MKNAIKFLFAFLLFTLPLVYSLQTNQIFEINKFVTLSIFTGVISVFFSLWGFQQNERKIHNKKFSLQYLFVFVFFAFLSVSTFLADTSIIAFFGGDSRHQGLFFILNIFLLGYIASKIFSGKNAIYDIEKFIFSPLLAVGVLLSIHSISQKFGYFPVFSELNVSGVSMRSFATMGQPNFLAQFLIFPFVAGLYFLVSSVEAYSKRHGEYYSPLLFICCLSLLLAGLWGTGSKAGILGFFVAGFLFVVGVLGKKFAVHKKNPPNILFWGIGAVIFGISLLIFLLFFFSDSLIEIFGERGRSALTRTYFWSESIPIIRDNFFFGVGGDNLAHIFAPLASSELAASENFTALPDRVHNFWLDFPLHFGIPAFILLLFGGGVWVKTLVEKQYTVSLANEKIQNEKIFLLAGVFGVLASWTFGFGVTTDFTLCTICIGLGFALSVSRQEHTKKNKISQEILPMGSSAKTFEMIKKIIMTGLLFLWGIFSVYIGITTWKADKAYFSLQSEKNQAEKILLWEDIKKAPYLEKNILGSFSPIFGVYKNEILQIGKKYSYQSSSFRQREMWYFFNTQESEKAWKKFLETFQTSGKDIRQKIFLIDLGMKIFPEKQRSLLLLAEDTYQIIPEKYFSSDSLDDFMVEKFWNDDSLSRSTYGLLSLLSKISTDEKYCKNILDIKKEFSLQQRIPKKCL